MNFEMLNAEWKEIRVMGKEWGRVYRSTSRKDTDRWQLCKWKHGAIIELPEFNTTNAHQMLEKVASSKNSFGLNEKFAIIKAMAELDDRF